MPGFLGQGPSQLRYANAGIVEQAIDARIVLNTTTNFCEDGSRNAHQGALLMSEAQDCCSTDGENTSL